MKFKKIAANIALPGSSVVFDAVKNKLASEEGPKAPDDVVALVDLEGEDGPMTGKHKLGGGSGTMYRHSDGSASYRKMGAFTPEFRVNVADVTGFVVSRGDKVLERKFKIMGQGTDLATAEINHGAAEKIERWFREQTEFNSTATTVTPQAPIAAPSMADELAKLASLRDQGILTAEEFVAQKAKILGA
jgi:Short C-terminal domain